MTAHELGRKLLAGPNITVTMSRSNDSLFAINSYSLQSAVDSCDVGGFAETKPDEYRNEVFFSMLNKESHSKAIQLVVIG